MSGRPNLEPSFTLGVEEEYFLVDRATGAIASEPPAALLAGCQAALGPRVSPEFLRSQIEVSTGVHRTIAGARADLAMLRATIAAQAGRYGLAPIAAATHPSAEWGRQKPSEGARYVILADQLQLLGRRLAVCGMHVHVGVEDDELRIDLMNQVAYFLPHLLALSTSSPFWRGDDTGLASFRLAVLRELPRTGVPELFGSFADYQQLVGRMVEAGLIDEPTKLWWDIRPSTRFPTLEMRVTDVCTRLDHAVSIAALFRCLLRMLWRLRRSNQRWRHYARALIEENRWRAQRFGLGEGLADFGRGEIVPLADLVEEMIALVAEDAEHFGCVRELQAARAILADGNSADRQRRVFAATMAEGAGRAEALRAVVADLAAETVAGLVPAAADGP